MKYIGDKNTGTLFSVIYSELREDIISGKIASGATLREIKLSKELGVSRTPVREAIRQLEQEGLVRYVPNKGAVVIGISKNDIEDMYTIRIFTESLAAEWAAERISDEELNQLREAIELQEFYAEKNDFVQVWQCDAKFHNVIYNACRSRMLKTVLTYFNNYTSRARERSIQSPSRLDASVKEHRTIYEAIRSKDPLNAKKAAEEHLINSKKSVIESMHAE